MKKSTAIIVLVIIGIVLIGSIAGCAFCIAQYGFNLRAFLVPTISVAVGLIMNVKRLKKN